MPRTDWDHALFEYRRAMGYTPAEVRQMGEWRVARDLHYLQLEQDVGNAQAKVRQLALQDSGEE